MTLTQARALATTLTRITLTRTIEIMQCISLNEHTTTHKVFKPCGVLIQLLTPSPLREVADMDGVDNRQSYNIAVMAPTKTTTSSIKYLILVRYAPEACDYASVVANDDTLDNSSPILDNTLVSDNSWCGHCSKLR